MNKPIQISLSIIFCFGFLFFSYHLALAIYCPYERPGDISISNVSVAADNSTVSFSGMIYGGECSWNCNPINGWIARAAGANPITDGVRYSIYGTSIWGWMGYSEWVSAYPDYCMPETQFYQEYVPYEYYIYSDSIDISTLSPGTYYVNITAYYSTSANQYFDGQFSFYKGPSCVDCGSDYWTSNYQCTGYRLQREYMSQGCSNNGACGNRCVDGSCYSNPTWYDWQYCDADHYTNNYRCSGSMIQREYWYAGCRMDWGGCYSFSAGWFNQTDCGSDYWTNNYQCSGTMIQRQYVSRGCSGGGCYSNTIWYNWSDCGSDYWADSYTCSGTMQQRLYHSRGCSGGGCYDNASWQNWSQCGSDYWGGSYQCSGSMIQRLYYSLGCSGGSCYNNASWQNWSDCGSDYWTNNYQCSGTMIQRQYVSRGCSGGGCYSNTIWYNWSDCGSDYWGSLYSCSGDWRTRQYFSQGCSSGSCYLNPSYQNWENCNTYDGWYGSQLRDYYCSSGACVYSGNTTPNVPILTAPPNNTWINYNPTFQATVSDPDGGNVRAYFNILSYADYWGSWVSSGGTSSYGTVNLGSCAQYWWRAYTQDPGGLNSTYSGSWLAKVDKDNPPDPTISYPTGTTNNATFTVSLTESDACSGIASGDVDIRVKPSHGGWGNYQDYASTINDFSYTGTDGSCYKFRYRVTDNAGNTSNFTEGGELCIALNHPPTTTNLIVTPSNVCNQPAQYYSFNFTYTDQDSDTQSQFDFQIDNNSNFSSPEVNRSYNNLSYSSPNTITQAISLATSATTPGCDYLTYNTTYYWRARTYDAHGADSGWVTGTPFTTSVHHYPLVNFTWTPTLPNVNETTQFTDNSKCWDEDPVNGADCSPTNVDTFYWTLNSATPATSTAESPTAKFATPGYYNVTEQVTDRDGHTCSATQSVHINYPLPKWKEVKP